MYTQRHTTPEGGSIPQNYSGNAFRYPPIGTLGQEQTIKDIPIAPPPSQEHKDEPSVENYPVPLEPLASKSPDHPGLSSLLGGHGIGNEELLLLGLCFLLSGEGSGLFSHARGKGDVVPYLLLLLIFS